jgi:hypothetical protein
MTGPVAPHSGRVLRLFPKSLCKFYAESAVCTVALMACNFDESVAVVGLLDQPYTVRNLFSLTAEIPDLETGTRLRGVTSDLSSRVFGVYKQPSRAPCSGPPYACEEKTESRDPRCDPESCADWNAAGVPRYRPCVARNSNCVDRESQKACLTKTSASGPASGGSMLASDDDRQI